MNDITPYLNDISTLLHSADRPEVALLQRYEITPNEQKINFILSLIGKLIEQDRALKAAKGDYEAFRAIRAAGITVKEE